MRTSKNVSITLPPALLKEAERVAKKEGRTRSELFREALRRYISQAQFRELQRYGVEQAKRLGLRESDVERLIDDVRQEDAAKAGLIRTS